jgi:hypothetical protein
MQFSAEHAFTTGIQAAPLPRCKKLKLTETQAMAIFYLRPDNAENSIACTSAELAAYYKVTRETIKSIWSGKTWAVETGMAYRPRRPKLFEATPTQFHSAIDEQLYHWANGVFIKEELFTDDSIVGLD